MGRAKQRRRELEHGDALRRQLSSSDVSGALRSNVSASRTDARLDPSPSETANRALRIPHDTP